MWRMLQTWLLRRETWSCGIGIWGSIMPSLVPPHHLREEIQHLQRQIFPQPRSWRRVQGFPWKAAIDWRQSLSSPTRACKQANLVSQRKAVCKPRKQWSSNPKPRRRIHWKNNKRKDQQLLPERQRSMQYRLLVVVVQNKQGKNGSWKARPQRVGGGARKPRNFGRKIRPKKMQ